MSFILNYGDHCVYQTVSYTIMMFQENLGKHGDVMFGSDYSENLVNQDDLVGFDLCVLASSHHTIITYGTFGLWGSLLAGGDVVAAKGRNNITLTEVGQVLPHHSGGGGGGGC